MIRLHGLQPEIHIILTYLQTGGDGWDLVTICSTCENQDRADYRLPILLESPIKHREIISEPMLGDIDIEKYLATGLIEHVTCGGESGSKARPCDFRWIQDVRRQCIRHGVSFYFKRKNGIIERENYNKPKSEDSKQPGTTPEKEKAITEALKHFNMI